MKLFFLFLFSPALLWCATTKVELEPVADTFIKAQEPNQNFGAAPKLEAAGANERIALLRFDLTRIPATAVVSSARLTLVFDVPKDQLYDSKFTVCDLNKDFSETEATYKLSTKALPWAAPGLLRGMDYGAGSLGYCSAPIRLQGPGPASALLTDFVRMAVESHRKAVNLAVFSAPESFLPGSIFSRRAPDPATHPKLELIFDPTAPKALTNHPFLEAKFGPVTLDASASANPDGSKSGLTYLWTVDRPAPASTYSPGQELGHEVKLKFEPDAPGLWNVRLRVTNSSTKESSETTVEVTDIQLRPHPRLGLNDDLLTQIKALQSAQRPEWTRFQEWLDHPGGVSYGSEGQGRLLGYVVTKRRAYFDAAWNQYAVDIYANGRDRSKGLKPFFGECGLAVYCGDHEAGYQGGYLLMQISILYDWGFDALTPIQRQDLIDWLNEATSYNFSRNSFMHSHLRNDGMVMTLGLAAAAYATYGENRQAAIQMSWFRQEWAHTLEALDVIGRGGALGEGNAYGEAAGGRLIDVANLVFYASGENLFESHPYFRKHLAFEAFSTYPNPLPEARPYPEGAALGGDDSRGHTWHSIQLRPNGLALARRFAGSEEAEIWNWVFRQKDNDQSDDSWIDVFFYSPAPSLTRPKRLSWFDPSMGYVYIRSDWNSRDATWISSWAGPHVDLHQHEDQGSFTLFKRRDLAAKTGNYDYNPLTPHFLNYYTRTVSSNNILIGDPNELFWVYIAYWGCDGKRQHDLFPAPDGVGKVCIANDGGQRTMAPYSMSIFNNEEFNAHRRIYDTAKVTSFADNGQAVSWVADITNAYSNPQYAAPGNQPKVTKVYRKFVYLRQPDVLLIADTVDSTNPNFEKSWLLHAIDTLRVGGAVKEIDPGQSIHSGTNRALLVVDDKHPSNEGETTADLRAGYAALQLETLFPNSFQYQVIGGREPAKTGHKAQGQTDPKNVQGDHLHRHFKDFWVKDYSEGVLPDHRSLNWAPVYPQEIQYPNGAPAYSGGYGRWRLELQPTVPARNDYFLNVLKPTLETADTMPELTKFETDTSFGASFNSGGKAYKVTFTKETLDPPSVEGSDLRAPVISQPKPSRVLPAGTKQTTISVTTNEPATCHFSYRPDTTFPSMTGVFQTSDGLAHAAVNRELNNGDTYTYFVRCQDKAGNETLEDLRISFSVAH